MGRYAKGTPLIEAEGLTVRHGALRVLDGVDITLRAGSIVTLIGLNGAGKSTLVRALLGLVPLASGRLRRIEGLVVGYTPQTIARDASLPLSVARFLALGAPASMAGIEAVLEAVGAPGIAGRPFAALSGGELNRVMLARALLREPDLLVLDEPVSAVDVAGQAELYTLVSALRDERGVGVLLVSHDLHLVMARADEVVCLNRHVCCTGHASHIIKDPAFIRLFGARIAGELALYQHHHDHVHEASGAVRREGDGHG